MYCRPMVCPPTFSPARPGFAYEPQSALNASAPSGAVVVVTTVRLLSEAPQSAPFHLRPASLGPMPPLARGIVARFRALNTAGAGWKQRIPCPDADSSRVQLAVSATQNAQASVLRMEPPSWTSRAGGRPGSVSETMLTASSSAPSMK